ncbi:MAG: SpoIIIAH-like family protein [Lachnospiraceae bacterium]|uniref:SpoIIIAH-like family protein n=1 Tax=uncultured Acetatifactor sp. TaxID=1671927 RepID=UPI00261A8746|nr:SpoIIIAH-like family protein [uncultured Acetatifactor sp.]MCI8787801.1 SpoIIIAH-like family protein [Lachnospiraceae bacterium]
MKNLIKKNQLMITALAIMIAIAGYLQFAGNGLEETLTAEDSDVGTGSASPVDSEGVITENYTLDGLLDLSEEDLMAESTDIESLDTDGGVIVDDYLDTGMEVVDASGAAEGEVAGNTPEDGDIPGEAVFTSTSGAAILSDAKLLKEQTRARNKETLMEIINSEGITDEQKQAAVDSMVEMTAIAEKEAAAEILLEAKGFKDVVVSINGDAVDVVVNAAALDDVMRAQIEDIVKRKTEVSAENIIISTVVQ